MDYLSFKAFNEGNDIIAVLAPTSLKETEPTDLQSYLVFLSISTVDREVLH